MIYKCRAPFMTKIGQFEPGKQTLVCGVAENVILTGKGSLIVTLGKSPKRYFLPLNELKNVRHTLWKNPQGKMVWIIPVNEFKTDEPKEEIKQEVEEEKPEIISQTSLF